MHRSIMPSLLLVGSLPVAACHPQLAASDVNSDAHGRYQGIGIAQPGARWSKIKDAPKSPSDAAATLRDDDYVVFVTDSRTGEVRECGDRSGFCTSILPWGHDVPRPPIALTEHASDDDVSNEAAAQEPSSAQ